MTGYLPMPLAVWFWWISWLGLLSLAVWESREILTAWTSDPSLRFAEYAFLLWLIGASAGFRKHAGLSNPHSQAGIAAAGCAFVLGITGELNALIYVGFVLLILAPSRSLACMLAGLGASVFWMPAGAWLLHSLLFDYLIYFQLGVCGVFAVISLWRRFVRRES